MSGLRRTNDKISSCETSLMIARGKLAEAHEWFGSALRDRREELSISLRALAKRAKVSAAFLSDVERGNRHATSEMRSHLIKLLRPAKEDGE